MTRTTPTVQETLSQLSPRMPPRLATARLFAYRGRAGRFTAQREQAGHGRGTSYWRAYRRRAGQLRRAYLGQDADLTPARLAVVAADLEAGDDDPAPASQGRSAPQVALAPALRWRVPPVAGGVGRARGQVRLHVLEHSSGAELRSLGEAARAPGRVFNTDEWQGYNWVAASGREHKTVCHAPGGREWARDDDSDGLREVHVNTIEGLWTGGRNFVRPFRGISKWYLRQYGICGAGRRGGRDLRGRGGNESDAALRLVGGETPCPDPHLALCGAGGRLTQFANSIYPVPMPMYYYADIAAADMI